MRVHCVVHAAFVPPGAFETWARNHAAEVTYSRVYDGEPLPRAVDTIDLLVVVGGPQEPTTTLQECSYFDSVAEQELILACMTAGKAVVGVCLGAQLIGAALGAPTERSPEREVGNFPIAMTDAGRDHPLFADFGEGLVVGHWHGYMAGLTPQARVLADSEGCPRQIVEYSDLVYGLQCHLEFTPEVVEGLIAHSEDEFPTWTDHRFVQQPEQLRANHYEAMNEALFGFLDKLMADYQTQSARLAGGN